MYKLLPITVSKTAKIFIKGMIICVAFFTIGVLIGSTTEAAEDLVEKPAQPEWCKEGYICMTDQETGLFALEYWQKGRAHETKALVEWWIDKCWNEDLSRVWFEDENNTLYWVDCRASYSKTF